MLLASTDVSSCTYQRFYQDSPYDINTILQLHGRLTTTFPDISLCVEYGVLTLCLVVLFFSVLSSSGSLMTFATISMDLSGPLSDVITLFGEYGFGYLNVHKQQVALNESRIKTAKQLKAEWDRQNLLNQGKLITADLE